MPLSYRDVGVSKSGTQWRVLSHKLPIASIGKEKFSVTSGGAEYWSWHMSNDHGPPGYTVHGHAHTLDEAKAKIEERWRAWLDAAALTER